MTMNNGVLFLILAFSCSVLPLYAQQSSKKPDDESAKVPRYRFPETLDEQNEALESNYLMNRFRQARKDMDTDPHRPTYHFVNPEGTMNDPNGLCLWDGNWHLFYQASPPEDTRKHWGHAYSSDLMNWKDLPYAIYPDPEQASYSGSVLVEDGRAIAMYDGVGAGIMVAEANDPLLLNWRKITGKPVIPLDEHLPVPPIVKDVRIGDPFLWKKDGTYYAITGYMKDVGADGTQYDIYARDVPVKRVRANYLFKSSDLTHWEYLHPFVEGDRFSEVGDDGSCPYFLPIADRHILLFFSHSGVSQYLLGDYDKENDKFIASAHGNFNHGLRFGPGGLHAPSATPDSNGGIVTIFNMNSAKGKEQIMSLPVRLTLKGKDEIGFEPAGDIQSLRQSHQNIARMKLPANREMVLDGIDGNAMEIRVKIDVRNTQYIELRVLRDPDNEEYTRIVFFKDGGRVNRDKGGINEVIMIDASNASRSSNVQIPPPQIAQLHLDRNEVLDLQIFIDKSVVEVFANGKQYVAMRVYPEKAHSTGVSILSKGKGSELVSLDAWQMAKVNLNDNDELVTDKGPFSVLKGDVVVSNGVPLPMARGGHAAGVLDGRLVVAGGNAWSMDKREKYWLKETLVFEQGQWIQGPELPKPLAYSAYAHDDGGCYIAGGTSDGLAPSDQVYRLSYSDSGWREMPTLPKPVNFASGAILDSTFYVACGTDDTGNNNIIYELDLRTANATWKRSTPLNGPVRMLPALVAAGDYLYLFGGVDQGKPMDDLYRYDPATDTWTLLGKLPLKGYAWVGSEVDQRHILVTGRADDSKPSSIHKEVWILDLADLSMRQAGALEYPATTTSLTRVGPDEWWTVGGEPDTNRSRTDRVSIVTLN